MKKKFRAIKKQTQKNNWGILVLWGHKNWCKFHYSTGWRRVCKSWGENFMLRGLHYNNDFPLTIFIKPEFRIRTVFNTDLDPDPIFMHGQQRKRSWLGSETRSREKIIKNLFKNCSLLFLGLQLGCSSIRRDLSPQKRASSTWSFFPFFLFLWVIFALSDPDPADLNQSGSMRIRNRNTALNWGKI